MTDFSVPYSVPGSGDFSLVPASWHIQPVAKISDFDAGHPPVLTYAYVGARQ